MKTFYEMMQILKEAEENPNDQGLGDQAGTEAQGAPEDQAPPEDTGEEQGPPAEEAPPPSNTEDLKHYMFFSSLKVIQKKVEEILQMDPHEIDAMIDDGHDWAFEHVITAKDDIEEVYNWIVSKD